MTAAFMITGRSGTASPIAVAPAEPFPVAAASALL